MERAQPRRQLLRVAVDTNLFVSATIGRGLPFRLVLAWRRGLFVLVVSDSLIREVGTVLRRPYFVDRYGVSEGDVRRLERRFERAAVTVPGAGLHEPQALPTGLIIRDPNDVHVLRTALTGKAVYLVTGDEDLLTLDGQGLLGGLRIVTVREFLAVLEGQG